jgi:hypothetical protein
MTDLHIRRRHYLDAARAAISHAEECVNRAWLQHRHPDCPPLTEYARAAALSDLERLERMTTDLRQLVRPPLHAIDTAA